MAAKKPTIPAVDPFAGIDLSGASAPSPIGVSKDFQAQVPLNYSQETLNRDFGVIPPAYSTQAVAPRYFDGAQYAPAASLSTDELIDLQNSMDAAGLYDKNADIVPGVWTDADTSAYTRALAGANQTGSDDKTYIKRLIQSGAGAKQKASAARAPLVVHLTNPDDLKTLLQHGARDLYGGDLPEEDVQAFVDAYHARETSARTQAYNLGDPSATGTLDGGAGGSVVDPASPSNAAEQFIRTQHPNQVAATQFGNAMGGILDTLRQSA